MHFAYISAALTEQIPTRIDTFEKLEEYYRTESSFKNSDIDLFLWSEEIMTATVI